MTARRDQRWAEFVVSTGLPFTPTTYLDLTVGQRNAVIRAHNLKLKRQKGG